MRHGTILAFAALLWGATATAQLAPGPLVATHVDEALNYRLDLPPQKYVQLDLTEAAPDISFSAMRAELGVTTLIVVENVGQSFPLESYAVAVAQATRSRMAKQPGTSFREVHDLDSSRIAGFDVIRTEFDATVADTALAYRIAVFKDGDRAFQFIAAAPRAMRHNLDTVIGELFEAFSVIDPTANRGLLRRSVRAVSGYQSSTFGYRLDLGEGWLPWDDLWRDAPYADHGALHPLSLGANLYPVCWPGKAPPDGVVYKVMMQQAGEDYPSAFVERDEVIEKQGLDGRLLVGTTAVDGTDFEYYHWIVAGERCAYMLVAWGEAHQADLEQTLRRVWEALTIGGTASAVDFVYADADAARVGANLLAAIGHRLTDARSYRDAFRFLEAAHAAVPDDADYLTAAVQALTAIEADDEARAWLEQRADAFADNPAVQSWRAWLAYRVGDYDSGIGLYRELFATDFRSDDDFSAYLTMLAERSAWDEVDARYAAYTAAGTTDAMRKLHAQLLSRRGDQDAALAVLEGMTRPGVFDAELAYERLVVLDEMDAAERMLALAQQLVDAGYGSLQSYYYVGRAQFLLEDYTAAKEAFLTAQQYAPGNDTVREYLAAIDTAMGQGDVSMIRTPIAPVTPPDAVARIIESAPLPAAPDEAAADYVYGIVGWAYDGGTTVRRTSSLKARILDQRGLDDLGSLQFSFDPAYERAYVNSLVVRDADGAVIAEGDIDSYYLTTVTDGYEASTERTVHMPVPGLAVGTTVELIVTTEVDVAPGSFPLETVYFARSHPVEHSVVFVTGEVDALAWEDSGIPEPQRSGNSIVWRVRRPMPYRWEPLQPALDHMLDWVRLGTVSDDWGSIGREYLEEIRDQLDSTTVAARARRLVEGIDSPGRRIDVLSAYVQDEVQYRALEFGRRAYVPKPARETLRDRYGDCKDHAVLLHSMLQSVGIDSALALVSLSQQVVPSLASRDQFDHMIVRVRDGDVERFIDTTDKHMRLSTTAPRGLAGNYALVLGPTPALVQMPDYGADDAAIDVEREVEVAADGALSVWERVSMSGYHAAELRGHLRSIDASDIRDTTQRWLNAYVPDAELTDYSIDNLLDPRFDLGLELKFSIAATGGRAVTLPGFTESAYLEHDRVANRQFAFELTYPLRFVSRTRVRMADGFQPASGVEFTDSDRSRFGSWQRRLDAGSGEMIVEFRYDSERARFDAEQYRRFTDFRKQAARAVRVTLEP